MKEKLKKEGHHLSQMVKSCEDLAMTTGFSNTEIPGDLDRSDAGWEEGRNSWVDSSRADSTSQSFLPPRAPLPLSTVPGMQRAKGSSDGQATSFMKSLIFCMSLLMTLNFHRKDLVLSHVCVSGPGEGVRSSWERKSNRKISLLCKGSVRAALVYPRLHIMPT